jgi:hypothetical protein
VALAGLLDGMERPLEERADGVRPLERAGLAAVELQAVTSPGMVAKLIEAVTSAPSHRLWTQDADRHGIGVCDGCGESKPVVYSSCLQWCQSCWPLAPHNPTESEIAAVEQQVLYRLSQKGTP